MKKISFLVSLVALISIQSFAQGKRQIEYSGFFDSYYFRGPVSYTGGIGIASYRGDLANDIFDTNIGIGLSVGANYKIWPRVAFGAEFNYIMLSAKDKDTLRNIKFSGTVIDISAYGRFYLIDDIIRTARDRTRDPKIFKMYITSGIDLLRYNATAEYAGETTFTEPIENISYGRWGFAVPVGLGFQWSLSHRTAFITEAVYRYTFTDYLDGVSALGNPKAKDGFIMLNLKLQYSPTAPKKKKANALPPPAEYTGPKGTETWKTRREKEKLERPQQHDDYDLPDENGGDENLDGEENLDGNPEDGGDGGDLEYNEEAPPMEDGGTGE